MTGGGAAMTELTMSEALKDPLIRLVLRADKVSLGEFASILEAAASRRNRQHGESVRAEVDPAPAAA